MSSRQVQTERPREAERVPVDAATRLRPNDWSSAEIRIVNLSRGGFRAQCDMRLLAGSCVSLDVPGIGAVEAQVEWQRSGEFGAKFLQPIDLRRCAWRPRRKSAVLAELLVERAAALRAGRLGAELVIRRRILSALPVHSDRAPKKQALGGSNR